MIARSFVPRLFLVIIAAFFVPTAHISAAAETDLRTLFAEANEKFRHAVSLPPESRQQAETLYSEAAARWRAIADAGISNSRLWLNIANASFLAGDVGRAIAAFRRAESLAPRDQAVIDGLAAARAIAGTSAPATQRSNVLRWITQSRQYLPRKWLESVLVAAWSAAWLFAAVRLFRPTWPRWPAVTLLSVSILAALPFALDLLTISEEGRSAVVVADRIIARNGPSDSVYEPTFQEPLRSGIELDVLETRGNWLRCRLPDGRETWLPSSALEVF